jgi:ATP-dependent Lhr-like helicase
VLTPGPRLAALTGNRVLYRDGIPIALLAADKVQFLETLPSHDEWEAHKALLNGTLPAPSISPDGRESSGWAGL